MTASGHAAIVGVGQTDFSRSSTVSSLVLNMRAALAAAADAGIDPHSIDGIVAPSVLGATADDFCTGLGLKDLSFATTLQLGGAGPVAGIGIAAKAIESGLCNRALVGFGYNGYSEQRLGYRPPQIMFGESPTMRRNYEAVNGLLLPVQYYGMWAARYIYEHGWSDTLPFAAVASVQREYASHNPNAIRRELISIEDHQESRMISYPFRLLDCSQESDGGVAVILAAEDDPEIDTSRAVQVAGFGLAKPPTPDQSPTRPDFLASGFVPAGERAFQMAGLERSDINFAEIYDPFTFHVIWQLESLGFCKPGEAGDFILSGQTRLDGQLPTNTHGGLLSEAHVWGMNHVAEAVRQIRREANGVQVATTDVGLVTGTGDFGDSSVIILKHS